jgi:hypothetical protein
MEEEDVGGEFVTLTAGPTGTATRMRRRDFVFERKK